MSRQNLDLVRAAIDEWNSGQTTSRGRFHPDIEWLPRRAGTEGAYQGHEGVDEFVADTREVFDVFELRYELAEEGERVLAWGVIHVRAAGSGIETDIPTGGVFDFRDGKIVRWEDFGSKEQAVEALGRRG